MNKVVAGGWLVAALLLASMPAAAVDGVSLEAGQGDGTDMGRVALQWNWNKPLYQGAEWQVGTYWELGLGFWRNNGFPGRNEDITEIGLTPVLRLQQNRLEGLYAELGLGVHLMSSTTIGDKSMSTQFQFGNHLGVGYRFGVKRAFDLSYRYQHLSNASIKKPNDGINFNQIRLQYHF